MPRAWRLLIDGAASGVWNMRVDEALLHSAGAGAPPTLRLYTWRGPWLSLGYGQRTDPRRLAACREAGVGVVRRVTGGRAVLHGGDLTYALAAPEGALPPGLRASYRLVSRALRLALRRLGVDAETHREDAPGPPPRGFDCFAEPSAEELCAGGRKLAGSAQRRAAGGVLQHGSIRVLPDPPEFRAAAGLGGTAATSLRELGCDCSPEALGEAFAVALGEVLDARFETGELDPAERLRAGRAGPARDPAFPGPRSSASGRPAAVSRVPRAGR